MEKNAFLRELALILRQRNLTDDEIQARIEKISSFIDGLTSEERNALIGGTPNVAAIADRLFAREGAQTQKQTGQKDPAPQSDRRRADAQFKIRSDYNKSPAPQKHAHPSEDGSVAEVRRRDEEKLKQLKSEAQRPRARKAAALTLCQKYESERNFWVIFFCCIPLLFVFGALLLSVFAAVFFGLIALIIILVAMLAVAVAAGSAVAIIGIGYGIITMLSNAAIGLYELGMGIFVAGVTMLVGVLIYNIAIRLVPFTMRQLRVLFKFIIKKLGVLAEYLKGVCALI